jgi:hypothetical protein
MRASKRRSGFSLTEMPPKRQPTQTLRVQGRVGAGAGMTAGLEIWAVDLGGQHRFVLIDTSTDGRFASDVTTWNTAAGLNEAATKILKDAT